MLRFLITGVGGDVAQAVCRVTRESFDAAVIVGTDISTNHAGSLFVDYFRVVPRADGDTYVRSINALIKEFGIDVLIPSTEAEIQVLSQPHNAISHCRVIMPGRKVVGVGLDKYKTNQFLGSIGLDVPWTVKCKDGMPAAYPCIFKSITGAGSKLLYIVADELEAQYLRGKHPDTIFQELLLPDDNEITCAVFRSTVGEIEVLQLQRSLVGGATSWARVVFHPEVDRVCKLVATELELLGSMNIQLRLTPDGPRIFEINPRFSSTVYMRFLIGFNDVLWSINDCLGVESCFPKIPVNTELVRTYDYHTLVCKSDQVD